jgi:hypothetical protein
VEGRWNPFQHPPLPDKNAQDTPEAGTLMRKSSGAEVSNMETEENPKTDLFDPKIPLTNDQSFVEKLCEIDKALNFCQGTCMENSSMIDGETTKTDASQQIQKPSNPEPSQPKPTKEPTRLPLGEIINTPFSPKKSPGPTSLEENHP